MAFTEQELSIAKQVKEQWGSREDFIEILQQMRKQKPAEAPQVEKAPVVSEVAPETPLSKIWAPMTSEQPSPDVFTAWKLQDVISRQQGEIKTAETEKKAWELLWKWFISETGEALWERSQNIKDTLQRQKDELAKQVASEWVTDTVVDKFKNFLIKSVPTLSLATSLTWDKQATWLQVAGQVAWWVWDVLFEGIENLVQAWLPKEAEVAIAEQFKKLWEWDTAQWLANWYQEVKEKNPDRLRNIEAVFNIGQFIPIGKVWSTVTKPFTKAWVEATKKTAEQSVKDVSRGLLNIPSKLKPAEELKLGKFFAEKVKPTDTFDNMTDQFSKIWSDAIDKVNSSLKSSSSLHKPQGAKEVLKAIDENLKNVPFATNQKKTVKDLLKKFNKEWLTLTDLNKIKRSINEYTRAWTAAWKEAAWLAPEAMRWKYNEVKTFIENIAKKEGLPDIGSLNNDWIQSNTLFELLSKQATSIGKKKGVQALQDTWIIRHLWTKIRQLREDLWFSDLPWAQWLEDINLAKAIETLKKANQATEKVPFLDTLKKKVIK